MASRWRGGAARWALRCALRPERQAKKAIASTNTTTKNFIVCTPGLNAALQNNFQHKA
jgi:hypothetical protein